MYPIEYKKIYYKKEINTEEKYNDIFIKSEDIRIEIKHNSDIIKKDNSEFLEEYDEEIFKINGKIQEGERNIKLNFKSTPKTFLRTVPEYKEGSEEISYKWHLFTEDEHSFRRYKRLKYIYNFGEPEYSDWYEDEVVTYKYN